MQRGKAIAGIKDHMWGEETGRWSIFPRFERASPPSSCLPHSAHEDQQDLMHTPTNIVPQLVSEHSLRRVSCNDNSNSTYTSMKEDTSTLPSSEHASPSPDRFPWLLPHFVAGSLIELRDGRLRRVEHLQTEDFLLGSLACPDLRLSCCTVQSISPSAYNSSSSLSRLLILLHDQQTQVKENHSVDFNIHNRTFPSRNYYLSWSCVSTKCCIQVRINVNSNVDSHTPQECSDNLLTVWGVSRISCIWLENMRNQCVQLLNENKKKHMLHCMSLYSQYRQYTWIHSKCSRTLVTDD